MEALYSLICDAVEDAIAEGPEPAAVLLSGGIDSSTIAYFADDLPLYTGWYEGHAYDERLYARSMTLGRDHREIEITAEDFVNEFDRMIEKVDPPWEGPGTFGQYMVAKAVAADGIKLLLSGEGGDELFGGYARLMMVAGFRPPNGYEDYVPPDDYPRDLMSALEWEWDHLPALLRVDEMCTAAHGLTAVAPMLDRRVVEFVMTEVAPQLRVGKMLLRETMRWYLPDEIICRRDKRGFPVPYVKWAQVDPVRGFVEERIGYVPDPLKPWDREWWYDLCNASKRVEAAA